MKNIRKKQKGITLIALVVTITVLLILAGIAIAMLTGDNGILKRTTDAKTANEQGTEYEKVRLAAQAALVDGNGTINITDISGDAKGSLKKALIKEFGEQSSIVTEYARGRVTIGEEEYLVTTNGTISKIKPQWTWTDNQTEGVDGYGQISVGDLITSKKKTTEKFYVIGFSEDNTKVNLLAKNNLTSDGSEQDPNNSYACVFSSTNYWSGAVNLNNYEIPSNVTSIVTTAKAYGESLDVEGRLMTVEEVENLGGSTGGGNGGPTSGCPDFINTQSYWLGNAIGKTYLWRVSGNNKTLDGNTYNTESRFGVRPVLEVSMSSI